jgi:hypothetical protein
MVLVVFNGRRSTVIQKIRRGIDKHRDKIKGGEAMICRDSDNGSCAIPPKKHEANVDVLISFY